MPLRQRGKFVKIPCPNCGKNVVAGKARWADCPPTEVVPYSRSERRVCIGHVFFHEDGTLCDESIFSIKQLTEPVFLRLGDSKVDPRT